MVIIIAVVPPLSGHQFSQRFVIRAVEITVLLEYLSMNGTLCK